MRESDHYFRLHQAEDGPAYLQAPHLTAGGLVEHAFSTRRGGCSSGAFTSLNTAYHVGDSHEKVIENRRIFFDRFKYDFRGIVSSTQVHGTAINVFNKTNSGEGALPFTTRSRCDALVTEEPGLPLAAYSADCLLIYFVLPRAKPLVALAHAGWRGTLDNMGGRVVRFLKENFSADPGRLLVALSPAVCRCCYEVHSPVAEQFRRSGWDSALDLEPASNGRWHLDLSAINAEQLLRAGVRETNLAKNRWCTSCHPEWFYSYRREKGVTGRMIGFIAINNTPA